MNRDDDPFGSPLSSAPSSRSMTPEPNLCDSRMDTPNPDEIANKLNALPEVRKRKRPHKKENQKEPQHGSEMAESSVPRKKAKKLLRKEDPEEIAKSKKRGKDNKKKKRQNKLNGMFSRNPEALEAIAKKQGARHYRHAEETPNENPVSVPELRTSAASTAFQGNPRADLPEKKEYDLAELYQDGKNNFKLIKKSDRTQYVPCPKSGSIHVVISPGPKDDEWPEKMKEGADVLREYGKECRFNDVEGRRGILNSINWGISLGNGQPKPMNLNNQGTRRKAIMEKVRSHHVFISVAGLMSTHFFTWAPLLFLYYADTTGGLLEKYPELQLPFYNSVFAAFTVNFGPRTVCLPHRDSKNLAFGWCAITALGNFDYTRGGHLVLWDLKLIIEFPPGYTIFIPSAVVCHLNTTIQPGEDRFSFTMYTAGELFRWAEHGYQTETDYKKTKQAKTDVPLNATRWARGMDLFSSMEELKTGFEF
ncbi:hypothetical protein V5O48_008209 [Marasmius crinis-equi]|uniref:Uncharacterized protein n=1 Tax=Marasmius crinis-equi TaxID=585013 RepID=A0ABR3FFB7_9AGAR